MLVLRIVPPLTFRAEQYMINANGEIHNPLARLDSLAGAAFISPSPPTPTIVGSCGQVGEAHWWSARYFCLMGPMGPSGENSIGGLESTPTGDGATFDFEPRVYAL
uniref:Uncharacterized protein n=1 Tax=Nelumbo nucifera TaxID=4432 RepID=A0A822XKE4_NELNU|nr:TPA_asm: hypothetical protein HUJ06_022293 [Nelumbo nucifera]